MYNIIRKTLYYMIISPLYVIGYPLFVLILFMVLDDRKDFKKEMSYLHNVIKCKT